MGKVRVKINPFLWLVLSLFLFIVFGSFVRDGTTKNISYWEQWGLFFKSSRVNSDFYIALFFGAFFYAIPAIILGWMLMALFQTALALFSRVSRPSENTPEQV
ncbi:MAG: hypothetical protein U0798_02520 [Gemmataceae bacterium]